MWQLLKREINLGSMINELGFNRVDYRFHHSSTSHIHLKYHFIRFLLDKWKVKMYMKKMTAMEMHCQTKTYQPKEATNGRSRWRCRKRQRWKCTIKWGRISTKEAKSGLVVGPPSEILKCSESVRLWALIVSKILRISSLIATYRKVSDLCPCD